MRKRYKVFLTIIVVLVLVLSAGAIYMKFFYQANNENTNKSNVVHNIDEYGYTLDDRDTKLMKDEFYKLEDILDSSEIDYQAYAESLSKLFIIDLFTIDNKINKYDVGGLEYLYETEQDKFKNIIMDSIYKNVLDNSNHKREQELPEVQSITIENVVESTYTKDENSLNSYQIEVSWDYVKDLGIDAKAIITIVKDEAKLYVVEYNPDVASSEVEE